MTAGSKGDACGMASMSAVEPVATLSPQRRRGIFAYLGSLTVLLAMVSPASGLFDVPISFFLKNRLDLPAGDVATFRLVAGIPLYLSFAFGLLRDTWHPFGLRDRGYVALCGAMGVCVYALFSLLPATWTSLLAASFLVTAAALCGDAAQNGLSAVLGRRYAMTGQISALDNFCTLAPGVAAPLLGGAISDWIETVPLDRATHSLYGLGVALSACAMLFALWRPAAVFDDLPETPGARTAERASFVADLRRLLSHGPIWPALGIWLLWNFAPGSTTPLQYHLQNTLGASDAQWGAWNAIFAASFLPTFVLFSVLCRRVTLAKLLFWGTLAAIPQFVPLAFVDSATAALIAAVPIGLMGGVATAAYTDLLIRSCPQGLEGTMMMLSGGLYFVSARFGDVLGTWLYERTGTFTVCVSMITAVYAAILVVLRFVPPDLVATADGTADPAVSPLDAPTRAA